MALVVRSFSPDYSPSQHPAERMALLFGSLIAALLIYNLIKGKKPEPKVNVADKHDVTSKNISRKLEKQQKR
ncbi:hypothetical protein [Methanobacterium aggregans]|uniref:hypothetical protein n=1 Tax=Methanobacterium aggregans TaxID=1615586 RepID=UPI001AE11FC8|nr:hypothetical protein [Methanobacterium aggregans]MBP2045463.1 hypothetical protein [Methanobacterium aggregans]